MQTDSILSEARNFHQAGQLQMAETRYRELLQLDPTNTMALYGLSLLAYQARQYGTAEELIKKVIAQVPDDAQPLMTLGTINRAQGNINAAIENYQSALVFSPENPDVLCALGAIYRDQNNYSAATEYYKRTVAIQPGNVIALANLGNALWKEETYDEATEIFRKVVDIKPDSADALNNLGKAYQEQDYFESAIGCFQQAADLSRDAGTLIRLKTALPIILESTDQIDLLRSQLEDNLTSLLQDNLSLQAPDLEINKTNFIMAYHGRDDKRIQEKFARLYEQACPSLCYTAPHCSEPYTPSTDGKIRIGFISRFFKNYSIGRSSQGIIEHLSRSHFHVTVIFPDPPSDEMGHSIAEMADEVMILPNGLDKSRLAIAEKQLDILFYQDIGMDQFTYFLAFSRLARVQCTSFGHPVTTGIPNLDYYISTEDWEPEEGNKHYSEELLCLKGVASVAFYEKHGLPDPLLPRSHFDLDENDHIYICPQSLFKFHPEFDSFLAAILHADSHGQLILIEGKHKNWHENLLRRFHQTMPDVADRITVHPPLHSKEFRNLIAVSDVVLDTIHFGGFNTSLDAFASGTPVVTLPGEFMRGRHTASMYHKMGIEDCIATSEDDYVEIALKLGTNPGHREQIKQRINDASDVLWEEWDVIREFERIFIEAMNACKQN